ncbi:sigma-70 family RNA polymerase sigma factor [Catenibacterium mitsuokai]|uniref:RNA polymerase sigma factor n=1 Tax=Catenibacterium mitsuokai TaxID=100886 RepID=UPI001C02458B|nr:sigma-70 family RNA polymerase sigma factor [Catenibacterium mitsuokai]MBT9814250.1 sigma-70 family RNA polymerase sigma factor [Catenibacterium mitsuokai]
MTIEDVIDTYGDMVTRICIMNLRNSDDAKDCFQEVFIKLYKHGMIEDHDYLKHWLIRVTINTCKDYRRVFYKKIINIEDVLIQDEKKDYVLLPVILDMPTRYKNVLYLYYYEGYKTDEISEILKMNINTVKSRLKRGREILKKKVGEDDE